MESKNTDYLKFYEDYFGIRWNRDKYEVHHIDHNRQNNAIENLILLPRKVHRHLHLSLIGGLTLFQTSKVSELLHTIELSCACGFPDSICDSVRKFLDATNEMKIWGIYKQQEYRNCIDLSQGYGVGERYIKIDGIWSAK